MQQITEQFIMALAPNGAAAANGRKLSSGGSFVRLERSRDDTFYLGECKGSGKSNYITTADYLDATQPVMRCSCPSRQFPCKHGIGLLYEIMSGKSFGICEIPDDILQKRQKKQAKSQKDESGETGGSEGKKTKPQGVNKSALTKKLKKQLEGLNLVTQLTGELMNGGLGAMGGAALKDHRQVAKQLGDYYLPGPQKLLNRLIMEMEEYQKDGKDIRYENALNELKKLWSLVKKSQKYLTDKLESGEVLQDDNMLYEELGGVWKLDQLEELGLVKENVRFIQLSFWVEFDEASGEFVDISCFGDVDTGEISIGKNYRPVKALKYIKQEDSVFGLISVPKACYYPGEGNRRVRWEGMEIGELTAGEREAICGHAVNLAAGVKEAKNTLKNPMSDTFFLKLIRFEKIGKTRDGFALDDGQGGTIALGDGPDMEQTVLRLGMLPDPACLEENVLLGAFYYDQAFCRLKLQPLSVITPEQIFRLLY